MKKIMLIVGVFAIGISQSWAQAAVQPGTPPPADSQLVNDWQALSTAVQHVQQDLIAKLQESAAQQKQIDDLKKQLDAAKPPADKK